MSVTFGLENGLSFLFGFSMTFGRDPEFDARGPAAAMSDSPTGNSVRGSVDKKTPIIDLEAFFYTIFELFVTSLMQSLISFVSRHASVNTGSKALG